MLWADVLLRWCVNGAALPHESSVKYRMFALLPLDLVELCVNARFTQTTALLRLPRLPGEMLARRPEPRTQQASLITSLFSIERK